MFESFFICDKCKQRTPCSGGTPQHLKISMHASFSSVEAVSYSAEWCKECALKAGFVQPKTQAEAETAKGAKQPTLEEMLIHFLEQKGFKRGKAIEP